eukprot:9481691-Pyramimonas_sp.AAC.3
MGSWCLGPRAREPRGPVPPPRSRGGHCRVNAAAGGRNLWRKQRARPTPPGNSRPPFALSLRSCGRACASTVGECVARCAMVLDKG